MGELLVSGRVLNLFSFQQLVAKLSDNSEQKNDVRGGIGLPGMTFHGLGPWVVVVNPLRWMIRLSNPFHVGIPWI